MNFEMHFLSSYLEYFPHNLAGCSHEQEKDFTRTKKDKNVEFVPKLN